MRVIGITGGVGSGKSRILDILEEEYGAQVIQADAVAKELMEPGCKGYEAVVKALGDDILSKAGTINRPALAEKMFHDRRVLETVNNIIHPLVWQTIKRRISAADLMVVEAALPGENHRDICGELWYVYTSEENRIRRLAESRGYSREKALSVMANQLTEREFYSLADEVIDNNGSIEETRRQIVALLKKDKTL